MKQLLLIIILISCGMLAYADNAYANFQNFDNQVSFGISSQNGNFNSSQKNGNPDEFSIVALTVEIEKLFEIGLWFDFNASVAQTYTQSTIVSIDPVNSGTSNGTPLGSYPYLQTMNAKIGYNFPIFEKLAFIPYIVAGKNTNLTFYNSMQPANVTNDFYYTLGGGLRIEMPITNYIEIYLDQLIVANLDQTSYQTNLSNAAPVLSPISTSNTQFTTTLGVKINPWEKLLIGANIFYTNYTGYNPESLHTLLFNETAVPTTALGFQVAAGFTFQ